MKNRKNDFVSKTREKWGNDEKILPRVILSQNKYNKFIFRNIFKKIVFFFNVLNIYEFQVSFATIKNGVGI